MKNSSAIATALAGTYSRGFRDVTQIKTSAAQQRTPILMRNTQQKSMDRRSFVKTMAVAAASPSLANVADRSRHIGIQIGAVSFLDEGIEQVLDILQERACVNLLFPAVFSYSNGTAGRQLPGHPFPGHGKTEYDSSFRGGNFARVHPQYYRDTGIDPSLTQAPDYPDFDLLASLAPAARKRGMKIIGLVQDHFPKRFPSIDKLQERDFNGQHAETVCKNNPYYRGFLAGLVEDLLRSYDVDGLMVVCEHQGAFSNTLGSRLRGKARGKPGSRTCFCQFCREKAEKLGIRFDRLLTAFQELEKFVNAGRSARRPADGYYVAFWRLMLRYPELLRWEHFFHESVREVYQLMHQRVKSVRPEAMFGIHVWHNASMSPIYRAEQDFAELARFADFLKVAVYHNCGGPRIASYIDSIGQTLYGDVPPEELLQFHYRVLNIYSDTPYEQVRQKGLSADYVYRESKRAMEATRGSNTLILPGIDVDIPVREADLGSAESSMAALATRASIREVVRHAFRAGVTGIVISRKYSEMRLESLSAVGDAVRESGLKA